MNTRYFVQVTGEENPRGPLPAGAVRKLIENGDITAGDAVCQEGDTSWLTLDDYWDDLMPPARTVAASAPAIHPALAVHPALVKQPLPVWKIVVGVLFFLWGVSAAGWALTLLPAFFGGVSGAGVWLFSCSLAAVLSFWTGIKLTRRS